MSSIRLSGTWREFRKLLLVSCAGSLAACGSSTEPGEYTAIRITPRELSVSLGTARPLDVTISAVTAAGVTNPLPRADVALRIVDTVYAAFKGDSVAGRTFGSTYLRAELRTRHGRTLRDSIPVYVIRIG